MYNILIIITTIITMYQYHIGEYQKAMFFLLLAIGLKLDKIEYLYFLIK